MYHCPLPHDLESPPYPSRLVCAGLQSLCIPSIVCCARREQYLRCVTTAAAATGLRSQLPSCAWQASQAAMQQRARPDTVAAVISMHQQFFLHTSLHFPAAGSSFCPLSGGVLHINLRVVQFNSTVAVDSECQVLLHLSLSTLQTIRFTLHTADCTTFHLPLSQRTCAFVRHCFHVMCVVCSVIRKRVVPGLLQ